MKGAVKPLARDPLELPEKSYDQMAAVLHTGGARTNVVVGSTVEAWAGEKMVGLTEADIVGRDYASPLAVAVQYWYPNDGVQGSQKKKEQNWTKHLSLAIATGWRKPALDGCIALVDNLVFPRKSSHGKANCTRMH